ncbi:hypothetical protein MMC22_001596 [Lobaria immixta]|nr:hypothetical protein [Lobaria immixta]
MPSFYRTTQPRPMPLTPPDHYGTYHEVTAGMLQHSLFMPISQQAIASCNELPLLEGSDFTKQHPQSSSAPLRNPVYAKDNNLQRSSNYVAPPTNSVATYAATNAPLLPPVRVPDRSHREEYSHLQSKRAQTAKQPKEDKAVGGVAAHLDYEMEQMADFVAEMAQGMYALYESRICLADIDIIRSVNPNSLVPPAFRKYVLQVLSSTRLPSTTILLGLYYLATRMTMLSVSGRYTTGSGQVYRMLVTSLLLGSKFLDDNTFQNRSWSEVSNIPVSELNVLEIEWLLAINWDMHVDSEDPQGFTLWHKHWDNWQVKNVEMSMDSLKLTPLDSSVQRQRSVNKHFSSTSLYPSSYKDATFNTAIKDHLQWHNVCHDQWPSIQAQTEYSPPSAPETGPNSPEWYSRLGGFLYGTNSQTYNTRATPMSSHALTPAGQPAAYHTQYSQHYIPNGWNSQGSHCGCGCCTPHHDHYFMAPGFGPQPVVG